MVSAHLVVPKAPKNSMLGTVANQDRTFVEIVLAGAASDINANIMAAAAMTLQSERLILSPFDSFPRFDERAAEAPGLPSLPTYQSVGNHAESAGRAGGSPCRNCARSTRLHRALHRRLVAAGLPTARPAGD